MILLFAVYHSFGPCVSPKIHSPQDGVTPKCWPGCTNRILSQVFLLALRRSVENRSTGFYGFPAGLLFLIGRKMTNIPVRTGEPISSIAEPAVVSARRPSWKRLAMALAVAALSDVLSYAVELLLPLQWALDLATAFLLFLILGRRWAILPGLIAEAIPGMGVFPVWVLVVLSIIFYDDIRARRKGSNPPS
jgi:hypothetical protein